MRACVHVSVRPKALMHVSEYRYYFVTGYRLQVTGMCVCVRGCLCAVTCTRIRMCISMCVTIRVCIVYLHVRIDVSVSVHAVHVRIAVHVHVRIIGTDHVHPHVYE